MDLPDGFFELVEECKERDITDPTDRKKINDEDIWDSAVFTVIIRLAGMLNEARSYYLKELMKGDYLILDKDFISTTSFKTWSDRLLKIIEHEKKTEQNEIKLATLGLIKPSDNPESPIRLLHDGLFNILEFIKNKPLDKNFINNLDPSKDKDLVGELKKKVSGIGFTKATLFCYGLGLANDYSAVSGHVRDFVYKFIAPNSSIYASDYNFRKGEYYALNMDDEDYYVINKQLQKVLEDFKTKDSKILMRHIDLAIYTLYVGRNQLFTKQNKDKITPRTILDWIGFMKFDLDKFLEIIADLDEIDRYSNEFTNFALARIH